MGQDVILFKVIANKAGRVVSVCLIGICFFRGALVTGPESGSDRNLLFQGGVGRGTGIGERGGLGGERGGERMHDEGRRMKLARASGVGG